MGTLGEYIAALREAKGWTQRELGRRAGFSQTTIHKIETGITAHPGIDVLMSLSTALQVSIINLVFAYQGKSPKLWDTMDVDAIKQRLHLAIDEVFE